MTSLDQAEYEFGLFIRRAIEANPAWQRTAITAMVAGLSDALERERKDRAEWETIAMTATDARLFKNCRRSTADRIEALAGRASFRWDHVIATLRKGLPHDQD